MRSYFLEIPRLERRKTKYPITKTEMKRREALIMSVQSPNGSRFSRQYDKQRLSGLPATKYNRCHSHKLSIKRLGNGPTFHLLARANYDFGSNMLHALFPAFVQVLLDSSKPTLRLLCYPHLAQLLQLIRHLLIDLRSKLGYWTCRYCPLFLIMRELENHVLPNLF